jgi:hypothetical protein
VPMPISGRIEEMGWGLNKVKGEGEMVVRREASSVSFRLMLAVDSGRTVHA